MKKYLILLLMAVSSPLWFGCYDEDPLTPSEEPEPNFVLPQGNHPYDEDIVDWNKRCGFYILYKFESKDSYWNLTAWDESKLDTTDNSYSNGIHAQLADTNYVDDMLALMEQKFFAHYPDSTLQKLMPLKVLLCSELWKQVMGGPSDMNVYVGFDYLAVNHVSSALDEMGEVSDLWTGAPGKNDLMLELHLAMLTKAVQNEKIVVPEAFAAISVYGEYETTKGNMYANGLIQPDDGWSGYQTKKTDFINYLTAIVQYSYMSLSSEVWWNPQDYSLAGILHASKDTTGKIRQKYDIVVNYFKETYNVDLQNIGNTLGY